jgi:hypothetical protein
MLFVRLVRSVAAAGSAGCSRGIVFLRESSIAEALDTFTTAPSASALLYGHVCATKMSDDRTYE